MKYNRLNRRLISGYYTNEIQQCWNEYKEPLLIFSTYFFGGLGAFYLAVRIAIYITEKFIL